MLGVESRTEMVGEQVVWAQGYGAHIPESLRLATALHRIALTNVEGPSYEHRSWFTAEHQLAESISRWFDEVRTWTEIMTGQDVDPNHRVYDAESLVVLCHDLRRRLGFLCGKRVWQVGHVPIR